MIHVVNTKKLGGVIISGDYEDLNNLYDAMIRVLGFEENTFSKTEKGIVSREYCLSLCYDLRHSYQGDREVKLIDNNFSKDLQNFHGIIHPSTNIVYEVNILWIQMMFQVLVLDDFIKRYSKDRFFNKMFKVLPYDSNLKEIYSKTRFEDIALIKLFQEKVWNAFREAVGEAAYKRLYKMRKEYLEVSDDKRYTDYCTQYIEKKNMEYVYSDSGKRVKLLARLVKQIMVKSEDYQALDKMVESYAKKENIPCFKVNLKLPKYPREMEL